MKITLVQIGKTEDSWIQEGLRMYTERLKHYTVFSVIEIPALKNAKGLSSQQQNEKEGELILKSCAGADRIYLLDEAGKEYGSVEFSKFLQLQMNSSIRHLFFVIGGPFGFSAELHQRANGKVSLSKMTFTHQMVRLFFTEQMYRAFTILKGEKYHHS